jgi:hypothetical protein
MTYTDDHLLLATLHVANAENRVKNQELLIRELEGDGQATEASKSVLHLFEETLVLMREHLEQIRTDIAGSCH